MWERGNYYTKNGRGKVSRSPGWPWIHCVVKYDLWTSDLPSSTSWLLGLWACMTTLRLCGTSHWTWGLVCVGQVLYQLGHISKPPLLLETLTLLLQLFKIAILQATWNWDPLYLFPVISRGLICALLIFDRLGWMTQQDMEVGHTQTHTHTELDTHIAWSWWVCLAGNSQLELVRWG